MFEAGFNARFLRQSPICASGINCVCSWWFISCCVWTWEDLMYLSCISFSCLIMMGRGRYDIKSQGVDGSNYALRASLWSSRRASMSAFSICAPLMCGCLIVGMIASIACLICAVLCKLSLKACLVASAGPPPCVPACLSACMPACLPACLHACLHACQLVPLSLSADLPVAFCLHDWL